jgi:hypothetical protein
MEGTFVQNVLNEYFPYNENGREVVTRADQKSHRTNLFCGYRKSFFSDGSNSGSAREFEDQDIVKLLILLAEVKRKRAELGLRMVVLGLKLLRLGILRAKNPKWRSQNPGPDDGPAIHSWRIPMPANIAHLLICNKAVKALEDGGGYRADLERYPLGRTGMERWGFL